MTFSLLRFPTGAVITDSGSAYLFSMFLSCVSSWAGPCHWSTPRFHRGAPGLAHSLVIRKELFSSPCTLWQHSWVTVHYLVVTPHPLWGHTEPQRPAGCCHELGNLISKGHLLQRESDLPFPSSHSNLQGAILGLPLADVGAEAGQKSLGMHGSQHGGCPSPWMVGWGRVEGSPCQELMGCWRAALSSSPLVSVPPN